MKSPSWWEASPATATLWCDPERRTGRSSMFQGGPRTHHERFQNVMAVCKERGG